MTHLPQVATQADQQLRVAKRADGRRDAHAARLDREARVEELARMLGGAKITARTREHAGRC